MVPAVLTWARGPKSKWKESLGVAVEVFVLTRVGSVVGGFSWELGVEDIDVEGKMERLSEGILSSLRW